MSLPTYDKFIEPLLRYLVNHPQGVSAGKAHDAVAEILELTDSQKQEMLISGQFVYKNRAGWAHDRLKRAGYSVSEKRGFWKVTQSGIDYEKNNKDQFSKEQIEYLALSFNNKRLNSEDKFLSEKLNFNFEEIKSSATSSPDDRLEQALKEIRDSVATELLEMLHQVQPIRFESIVLDVLHQLGYGANREDLMRVGGTGDAGIDGVISLDKLGLEKVYVQAKRWLQTVGRPELQAFYGALAGQKSKKGIFITTSSFTNQAYDFVKSVDGIVLLDGRRLVELMMDNEVGVSSRNIKIPSLDKDYFEED